MSYFKDYILPLSATDTVDMVYVSMKAENFIKFHPTPKEDTLTSKKHRLVVNSTAMQILQ